MIEDGRGGTEQAREAGPCAEHEAAWVDPTLQDPERVRALLKPDADSLVTRAVSTLVNSVTNDRVELLERPPDPR